MKFINVCDYDASRPEDIRLQTYGKYVGHYHSVRHIEVSDDFKYMLSSSEDHSIYLWLNETMQPDHILAGHTDLCSGATFLSDNTIVSSSWDGTIRTWNY